jgi:hypothetical protein
MLAKTRISDRCIATIGIGHMVAALGGTERASDRTGTQSTSASALSLQRKAILSFAAWPLSAQKAWPRDLASCHKMGRFLSFANLANGPLRPTRT